MTEINLEEQIAGEEEARKVVVASMNDLQKQINSLDATMKQMASQRQELVNEANLKATKAVELQGVIAYLKRANGQSAPEAGAEAQAEKPARPTSEVKIKEPGEETKEKPTKETGDKPPAEA